MTKMEKEQFAMICGTCGHALYGVIEATTFRTHMKCGCGKVWVVLRPYAAADSEVV